MLLLRSFRTLFAMNYGQWWVFFLFLNAWFVFAIKRLVCGRFARYFCSVKSRNEQLSSFYSIIINGETSTSVCWNKASIGEVQNNRKKWISKRMSFDYATKTTSKKGKRYEKHGYEEIVICLSHWWKTVKQITSVRSLSLNLFFYLRLASIHYYAFEHN